MRTISLLLIAVCLTYPAAAANLYDTSIKPGAQNTGQYLPYLQGKRVALIINQASNIGSRSVLDVLLANHVNVTKIFVPEHGFRGHEDAGATIGNTTDSATGLPVISLYGKHKKPQQSDLADVDIMVYDLQDVGVRFYTYISTLQYAMEACAAHHVDFLILDRPDPNGFYVAGPVLEDSLRSFIGMQPIPIVYGMTPGEYAQMLKGEHWFDSSDYLKLRVIPCTGYAHDKLYELPVAPSPNLRTMKAVYAYPSLCLFEGTPVSVGRGTDKPFEQYGSPLFGDDYEVRFTPESGPVSKKPMYEGQVCKGGSIGINEIEVLRKINNDLCLDWLTDAWQHYPEKDKFFSAFFRKLAGTAKLQEQIADGLSTAQIKQSWQPALEHFKSIRKKYLLYP